MEENSVGSVASTGLIPREQNVNQDQQHTRVPNPNQSTNLGSEAQAPASQRRRNNVQKKKRTNNVVGEVNSSNTALDASSSSQTANPQPQRKPRVWKPRPVAPLDPSVPGDQMQNATPNTSSQVNNTNNVHSRNRNQRQSNPGNVTSASQDGPDNAPGSANANEPNRNRRRQYNKQQRPPQNRPMPVSSSTPVYSGQEQIGAPGSYPFQAQAFPATAESAIEGSSLTQPPVHNRGFNPYAKPFVPRQDQMSNAQESSRNPGNRRKNFGVYPDSLREDQQRNQNQRQPSRGEGGSASRRGAGGRLAFAGQNNFKPEKRRSFDDQDKPLRERLIFQLENNSYECMICCQVVLARNGVWSCKKCYHMFHITGGCITSWAKKSREEDNTWRCPTCQTKYDTIPYNYYCFCGKERNPQTFQGEVPHSCGSVCGGVRGPGCPHPCTASCHPGPCVECPVMVVKKCNCGATEKAVRCGTDNNIRCDNICGKLMNCGRHNCKQTCHEGPCSICDEAIEQTCACGSESRTVLCTEVVSKNFTCDRKCDGKFSCGIHECQSSCHTRVGTDCGPCPDSVDRIRNCPCGRRTMEEMKVVRKSCTDPIPTCGSPCNKILDCGNKERHRCRSACHTGPCPPCQLNTSVICRCTQVKKTMPCAEYLPYAGGEVYLCERKCRNKKSCGVHKCQEKCCIQVEHLCMQICNKRLSCGLHLCDSICHAGQCGRCLQASFDEQFCHCGKTCRPPPIPCGAPLPECDEPCARPHACNHPVMHKCHGEDRCPPCTFLVEKMCYGNHEIRKNIPCHLESVSCGRICDQPLPCGVHNCNRNCHSGTCLKEGQKCTRPCTVLRDCEHICGVPCHRDSPCPVTSCLRPVEVMCDCGRKKSQMRCIDVEKYLARQKEKAQEKEGERNEEEQEAVLDDSKPMKPLRRTTSTEKLNCMSCDDDCKKILRNKKLAKALEIATNEDGDSEKELTITFTEYMKHEFRTQFAFVQSVEATFDSLIEKLAEPTNLGSFVSYNFKPMHVDRRRFIHEYSKYYHIDTISVDEVPSRSVIATAKRDVSKAPLILLSSLGKYPHALNSIGPSVLRSNINEEIKKAAAAADLTTEDGMRALRGERRVYKRMAPQLAPRAASPVRQKNTFAVLDSDNEDEGAQQVPRKVDTTGQEQSEKDHDWWSDEEGVTSVSTQKSFDSDVRTSIDTPPEDEQKIEVQLEHMTVENKEEKLWDEVE